MAKQKKGYETIIQELRDYALTFPGATEDFPWGDRVFKVKGKIFLFLSRIETEENLKLAVKLPETGKFALLHPFAEPTGYGLGKHGWISAHLGPGEEVPVQEIKSWIEESYRAIAPKKLIAQFDNPLLEDLPPKRPARPKAKKKKGN